MIIRPDLLDELHFIFLKLPLVHQLRAQPPKVLLDPLRHQDRDLIRPSLVIGQTRQLVDGPRHRGKVSAQVRDAVVPAGDVRHDRPGVASFVAQDAGVARLARVVVDQLEEVLESDEGRGAMSVQARLYGSDAFLDLVLHAGRGWFPGCQGTGVLQRGLLLEDVGALGPEEHGVRVVLELELVPVAGVVAEQLVRAVEGDVADVAPDIAIVGLRVHGPEYAIFGLDGGAHQALAFPIFLGETKQVGFREDFFWGVLPEFGGVLDVLRQRDPNFMKIAYKILAFRCCVTQFFGITVNFTQIFIQKQNNMVRMEKIFKILLEKKVNISSWIFNILNHAQRMFD